jgi:hypothetical protein
MPFVILKFLHVGSMFLATAFAVGPSVLLYRIARSGDVSVIRSTFPQATPIFRVSTGLYGLGILFGISAALSGQLDLTTDWLLLAYALVGLLGIVNLTFERWATSVEAASRGPGNDRARLAELTNSARARLAVSAMVLITVAIVYVMVTKPGIG